MATPSGSNVSLSAKCQVPVRGFKTCHEFSEVLGLVSFHFILGVGLGVSEFPKLARYLLSKSSNESLPRVFSLAT